MNKLTAHLSRQEANKLYDAVMISEDRDMIRTLCREDLFFLLSRACGRQDMQHDWIYDRVREVEADPNGHLDLWAREHYKSTIITFGQTIQDILNDPELTIGIFSLNRPIAKKFLGQIKAELADNVLLKWAFPEILYEDPEKEAKHWSLDDGLILKRQGNPKEPTLSAWGLIEGMPTSAHFNIRIYDDIIDDRNVTNTEMINKATRAWELSLSLGSANNIKRYGQANIERYVGTRYHYNDPYREILKRGVAKERTRPGTTDGTPEGNPVLWSPELLQQKRKSMGPYVFACQILQNPVADEAQNFKKEWLRRYSSVNTAGMNLYLLCDPAGEKKRTNDYTVMMVIGLGKDENYYLIDGIRDRLNLTERTNALFHFHRTYKPRKTGYEKYGKDSDIEHIQYVMEHENYRFEILPLGGTTPKNDRIRKLIPVFEAGRFYIPWSIPFTTHDGKQKDFAQLFIDEEFLSFPLAEHDDMIDCGARILHPDLKAAFPDTKKASQAQIKDMYLRNAPPSVRSANAR